MERYSRKIEKEENGVLINEKNENSTENKGETSRETEIRSTDMTWRETDQDGREETGRETERPGGQSIGTLPCVLISKMRRHCLYDRVGSYAQITGSPTNHHRVQTHMQKQRDFIQV